MGTVPTGPGKPQPNSFSPIVTVRLTRWTRQLELTHRMQTYPYRLGGSGRQCCGPTIDQIKSFILL